MQSKTILALTILALTIGAAGLTIGYSLWSISHTTTGHVTINTPPDPNPEGDFTVPLDITFPNVEAGTSTTVTVSVTSTLNEEVTLTAVGGAGEVTVTSETITLPAGGSADITLTLNAAPSASGGYTIPITFTVTE